MKSATLQHVHDETAKVFQTRQPVRVTRDGAPIAYILPLADPSRRPLSVRRQRFIRAAMKLRAQLDAQGITDEQIERDIEAIRKNRRRR